MTASRATRFANRDSDSSTFRPLGISATIMAIEVEQKFPIQDRAALERQLSQLGARRGKTENQVDLYFAHPSRDFSRTDEALRLRRIDDVNYITYKGPKLDATTKTRLEIELPLAIGTASATDAVQLLESLGFRRVAEVRKQRDQWFVRWQDREIGVSLDQVVDVGDFVELEIMAEASDTDAARNCITSLAERLKLSKSERRSYLELLLAGRH
jgi:adenylate cyclase, class 2